jgi:diguanylate cyclase (GGDEF)-like protein
VTARDLPMRPEAGDRTYSLLGLPGPVWMMGLWSLVNMASGLIRLAIGAPAVSTAASWTGSVGFGLFTLAALLMLRQRTPDWLLGAMTAVWVTLGCWLIALTRIPMVVTTCSILLVVAVLYIGMWWPGRAALLCATACSIGLLVSYTVSPVVVDGLAVWVTVSASLFAVAWALTIIVRQGVVLVTRDPLTGLLNRTGLEDYEGTHPRVGRAVLPRSVVVVDVDGFKQINDTNGHAAGDAALVGLAESWRAHLRPDDVAARLGGDEFVLVLPKTSIAGAEALIERLRERSDLPFSVGIVDWPADEELASVIHRADRRMYRDKDGRRVGD